MKVRKTDRPILFRAEMVRALLAGRKTQTRRILKVNTQCPYGVVGDTLWVKETYCLDGDKVEWRADFDDTVVRKWKSGMFMPRSKSRIQLRITDIRIEELQYISEEDAVAEGVEYLNGKYKHYSEAVKIFYFSTAILSFMSLWNGIHGENAVGENRYVWVITFERI